MSALQPYGPVLVTVGVLLSVLTLLGRESAIGRVIASATCIVVSVRYIWWHGAEAMPVGQSPLQQAWAWTFYVCETMSAVSAIFVFVFMSRSRDRRPDADARRHSPLLAAPVDVFIATYNEPYAVLERTIVGAMNIDHPDLRVWVLDDGARSWVRDLAAELGAHYTFRVKGKHAKAGNINNGLKVALSTGRRPEFILLLDADFVAHRRILRRTLGLFEEQDVGIVQTPQHFFNPDPIQSNLLCSSVWPDEQRFFFNVLLACKDAWGAAFCCGTSAVLRVAALEAAGGMATETVTEDMLTSFKLREHGYRTIYLNEPLSLGLAPEGLAEYLTQRSRWCLGAMQQVYTRWSFVGRGRIGLINRLSCFDTTLFWMFSFLFKLMVLSTPILYWWTETAVINASIDDMLYWLAPSVVASMTYMAIYGRGLNLPVMTDLTHLLSSFVIVRTVATALVKPWGHAFKVTPKGLSSNGITVQWRLLAPFAFMAAATFLGILVNSSVYAPLHAVAGYSVNVFWSIFNIAVLLLAAAVCIELPRRRKEERFVLNEAAALRLPNGAAFPCYVRDMSVGGARIGGLPRWTLRPGEATLLLNRDRLEVPCRLLRTIGDDVAVQFHDAPATRRALIAKLFTGGYRNEVERIRAGKVLWQVAKRLVA